MSKRKLTPLEFYLKRDSFEEKSNKKERGDVDNYSVSVKKYNTSMSEPSTIYKPISKIFEYFG